MGIDSEKAYWNSESEGLELLELTIGDFFDTSVEKYAENEALVYNYPELGLDLRLTYRQYQGEANRLAKGLMGLGIGRGEHVAIWATNLPEWAFLQIAAAKIGAVLVTVNTNYKAAELEYVLRQGDVSTLVMIESYRDNDFLDSIYNIAPELKELADPASQQLESNTLPLLKRVVLISAGPRPGILPFATIYEMGAHISDEELRARQAEVHHDDVAQMQFTSGTTGFPKGVQMTHLGMVNNARLSTARTPLDDRSRFLSPMPFFHVAGSVITLLCPLASGTTLVPAIAFDPLKVLELIEKERCTFFLGVPTMLVAVINHPRLEEFDLSSLTDVTTGGSPVPVSLLEQWKAKLNAEPWVVYGMTENNCTMTFSVAGDPFELKAGTVGRPLAHCDVKIVDPATGETAGFGQRGELCTRGRLVMKGYYKMPEKTAEAIDSAGWLHSGDLATMNPDGYVNIVGRVKDMVIRGGENIFPAEIEAFLMKHPKVAEAQIVGVPDAFMGEELVALLRLKPGETAEESELREYCRASISKQKTPKYIRFVDAFPLTASGKVKKFVLRETLIKELGLEEIAKLRMA